jgi:uncharacterized NAD-dependent epimerase/dehydratase family protein
LKEGLEKAVQAGVRDLERITHLQASSVAAVEPAESGWHLQVELLEKQSIPRGMDILGLYHAWIDEKGNLLRFERRGTRRRGDVSAAEG